MHNTQIFSLQHHSLLQKAWPKHPFRVIAAAFFIGKEGTGGWFMCSFLFPLWFRVRLQQSDMEVLYITLTCPIPIVARLTITGSASHSSLMDMNQAILLLVNLCMVMSDLSDERIWYGPCRGWESFRLLLVSSWGTWQTPIPQIKRICQWPSGWHTTIWPWPVICAGASLTLYIQQLNFKYDHTFKLTM